MDGRTLDILESRQKIDNGVKLIVQRIINPHQLRGVESNLIDKLLFQLIRCDQNLPLILQEIVQAQTLLLLLVVIKLLAAEPLHLLCQLHQAFLRHYPLLTPPTWRASGRKSMPES